MSHASARAALDDATQAFEERLRVVLQGLQQLSTDLEEILGDELPEEEVEVMAETRVAFGRRRTSDLGRLAYIADLYSKACLTGSAPNVVVTPELVCTPAHVKALVSQARRDKLLSETTPGKAGGELTDPGRRWRDRYLSRVSGGNERAPTLTGDTFTSRPILSPRSRRRSRRGCSGAAPARSRRPAGRGARGIARAPGAGGWSCRPRT
jgi:hypothetical protein